jgi:group I intron endonuclease
VNIPSGIYAITHIATGRCYVGCSVDVVNRLRKHKEILKRGRHRNKHLQNAWHKYGESAFTFSVLEHVPRTELSQREQFHTDAARPNVYNFGRFADCPLRGTTISDETRAKMSAAHKGHVVSPETRRKIGEANRINRMTPAHRAALIAANRGKSQSAETRAKRSRSLIGKKWPKSAAHRLKLSLARRGVALSLEHRAAIRAACQTPEHRAKLSAAWEHRRAAV